MINIHFFMISSIAVFLAGFICLVISGFFKIKIPVLKRVRKIVFFFTALILSIWILRVGAGLDYTGAENAKVFFEKLVAGFFETLQSFSMDADYGDWISKIGESAGNTGGFWQNWYIMHSYIMYIIAPITGGAIVFEIIASIFPHLKLAAASLYFFREILYFSELNPKTIALLRSIKNDDTNSWHNPFKRPIVVITDAYTDREEEKSSELRASAKKMGAICINDDLLHINIRKTGVFKRTKVFLIDELDTGNLQTITRLINKNHCEGIARSDIFLFSSGDVSTVFKKTIEDSFKSNYNYVNRLKRKAVKNKFRKVKYAVIERIGRIFKQDWSIGKNAMPKVRVVNGYRNLARNLLGEVPLYDPLVGKVNPADGKKYSLSVTIIGTGDVGTEMFLSVYWYGQLLNCRLKINVISKESREEFIKRIDYINPDIMETSRPYSDILRIYPGASDALGEPYFDFNYIEGSIKDSELYNAPGGDISKTLLGSDYIVVAIGSDLDNISVAGKINRLLSISNLEKKEKARRQTVLSYVVYDSDLCRTLNEGSGRENKLEMGVYMHAFGSLEDVYSKKNVYMDEYIKKADVIWDRYERLAQKEIKKEMDKNRSEYEFWANVSRALHIQYKVFSAGKMDTSVFICRDYTTRRERMNELLSLYEEEIRKGGELCNQLAWLEHRRWNAFSRVNGFRCPSDFTIYSDKTKEHKNVELKLHPCLVECDKKGMKGDLLEGGTYEKLDCLDSISIAIDKSLSKHENYKEYDYPEGDFENE